MSCLPRIKGLPCGLEGKESACNAGDPGSIPASGRSSGEGNDNPLQYSCLENPIDRGTWQAMVHWVTKSWTRLSNQHYYFYPGLSAFHELFYLTFTLIQLSTVIWPVEKLNWNT